MHLLDMEIDDTDQTDKILAKEFEVKKIQQDNAKLRINGPPLPKDDLPILKYLLGLTLGLVIASLFN